MSAQSTHEVNDSAGPRLILASGSARRRDLLRSAWIAFEIDVSDIPETMAPGESPAAYTQRMAREKAHAVADERRAAGDHRAVLGADTVVVIDGETIGKPRDRAHARQMLDHLSGRTHEVLTAFCVIDGEGAEHQRAVATEVTFRHLGADELERYLDRASWQDKAGAYAIQEHAAYMVDAIHGSYTNVVGLPLSECVSVLAAVGVRASVTQ